MTKGFFFFSSALLIYFTSSICPVFAFDELEKTINDPVAQSNNSTEHFEAETNEKKVDDKFVQMDKAQLTILNKITAKSTSLEIISGEPVIVGNLSVELKKCLHDKTSAIAKDMMFLHVTDHKEDDDPVIIFNGWMVANNLSISALEHAVYELIPIKCIRK